MEERCMMCPNQCLKSELKCGRGKHYFSNENKQKRSLEQEKDLTGLLIKTSQILNHKSQMKKQREEILDLLYQNEDISPKQLCDLLNMDSKTLENYLFHFQKDNLIKNDYSLSLKGKEIVENRKTNDDDLFDMLNQEEKEKLTKILEKVLDFWYEQHIKFHHQK